MKSTRKFAIIGPLLLVGAVLTLYSSSRQGILHGLPEWARLALGIAALAGTLAGVFATLAGLGLLTNDGLAEIGSGRSPTVQLFIAVYVGFAILTWSMAFLLDRGLGIPYDHTIVVCIGLFFLLAAAGRPWWVFATIRRMGWFASIKSDAALRWVCGALGIFFTGGALATLF